MRIQQFILLTGIVGSFLAPQEARAAEVTIAKDGGFCHVRVIGPITAGDSKRIEDSFEPLSSNARSVRIGDSEEHSAVICLDSPGGSYVEGLKIMNLLRDKSIGTVIEKDARCHSACGLIFMAGHKELEEGLSTPWRYLHFGGRLGFHAPYIARSRRS